eukprot:1147287-Pelagomonas_calceolata.AAC.14
MGDAPRRGASTSLTPTQADEGPELGQEVKANKWKQRRKVTVLLAGNCHIDTSDSRERPEALCEGASASADSSNEVVTSAAA